MRLRSRKTRRRAEVPTASLADIAFLLLIFFLVATTIDVDTGLRATLPALSEVPPPVIKERNMLAILVNAQGAVLVEKTLMIVADIRGAVVKHVTNDGLDPAYAETPRKALVAIETDAQTPYGVYIDVLDAVHLGYRQIWDAEARRLGYADYAAYTAARAEDQKDEVRARFPMNLALPEARS